MDRLIGKTLGHYQIVGLIGKGGMATVYKAFQSSLNRHVAIKVLPLLAAQDEEFARRFQLEAQAAAKLKHPNIVTTYDVGEEEGYHFIVEEFGDGATLADQIRREGPLSLHRTSGIIEQVASALDYAHSQGFIHRDVKPGNILIGAEDHATLTDFGIVKAAEGARLTRSGVIVGTPEYMAPEQIRGEPVDFWADVYALGIVCYEMLVGAVPFQGNTARVLYAQAHETPPSLCSIRRDLAPAVEAVVAKALSKDPAERYPATGSFSTSFRSASDHPREASNRIVREYTPNRTTRMIETPFSKNSTALTALYVIGAAVLGVLLLAFLLWRFRNLEGRAGVTPALIVANQPTASHTPSIVIVATSTAMAAARPTPAGARVQITSSPMARSAEPTRSPNATSTPNPLFLTELYNFEKQETPLPLGFEATAGARLLVPTESWSQCALDDRVAHSGGKSLKLSSDINTTRWYSIGKQLPTNCSEIVVSYFAKGNNIRKEGDQYDNCYVGFILLDSKGNKKFRTNSYNGTFDWRAGELRLSSAELQPYAESGAKIGLYVFLAKSGEFWVDDLKIELLPRPAASVSPSTVNMPPASASSQNTVTLAPAIPLPTPRPNFTSIVDEAFDASSWWCIKTSYALLETYCQDGKLHVVSKGTGNMDRSRSSYRDFVAQVELQFLENAGYSGLVFRGHPDRNTYVLYVRPTGEVRVTHAAEGRLLVPWTWASAFKDAAVNMIEVTAQGSHITISINVSKVTEVDDSASAEGVIGPFIGEGCHAVFDNLKIWELP